jgi:hypothetical protein
MLLSISATVFNTLQHLQWVTNYICFPHLQNYMYPNMWHVSREGTWVYIHIYIAHFLECFLPVNKLDTAFFKKLNIKRWSCWRIKAPLSIKCNARSFHAKYITTHCSAASELEFCVPSQVLGRIIVTLGLFLHSQTATSQIHVLKAFCLCQDIFLFYHEMAISFNLHDI